MHYVPDGSLGVYDGVLCTANSLPILDVLLRLVMPERGINQGP